VLIGNNKFKGTATEVLIDYKLKNLIVFFPTPNPSKYSSCLLLDFWFVRRRSKFESYSIIHPFHDTQLDPHTNLLDDLFRVSAKLLSDPENIADLGAHQCRSLQDVVDLASITIIAFLQRSDDKASRTVELHVAQVRVEIEWIESPWLNAVPPRILDFGTEALDIFE